MTTRRDAPGCSSFAQRVAALEAEISNPGYVEHATEDLRDLIRAVRDQQAALQAAKEAHLICEDCWYSCPKSGECCDDAADPELCKCGADEHNAAIDATLARWRIEP